MNQFYTYISHHWVIGVIIAIIAIFFIVSLIRAAIKIAIILLIIGVILVTLFGLSPNALINQGKAAVNNANSYFHKTIEPSLNDDINQAKVHMNPDGKFTINTPSMTLTGKKGDQKVTITYNNHSYTLNISQFNDHIRQTISGYLNPSNQ